MAPQHDGEEPSCGGGLRRLARRGVAALGAGDAAAAAGVRAWQGRARGAGGWCGAAFCVHRWYSVCGRCGRGERARGSAQACCAGWRYAAGAMRVGGPHGRGTLLRPCAPCNPARLMTQILGAVQPRSRGSVPCAGPLLTATGEAGIRRGRFRPLLHCSKNKATKQSYQTCLFVHLLRCVRPSVHWSSDPVTLSSFSDRRKPPPCVCRRQFAGAGSPGIGGGVFMATMVGGGASS